MHQDKQPELESDKLLNLKHLYLERNKKPLPLVVSVVARHSLVKILNNKLVLLCSEQVLVEFLVSHLHLEVRQQLSSLLYLELNP